MRQRRHHRIAGSAPDLPFDHAGNQTAQLKEGDLAMKYLSRGQGQVIAQSAVILALGLVLGSEAAMAGADTTFNTALTAFTGFLEGSGGKIITVLSLAGGIVGLASGRFSLAQVAIPVGVGVGAGTGVPIVTAAVTATI